MDKLLTNEPRATETGFDFPPYDFFGGPGVPEAMGALASATAFRAALVGAGLRARAKDLDAILEHEFLRLAAMGSSSPEEQRSKAAFLAEGCGTTGLVLSAGVTRRCGPRCCFTSATPAPSSRHRRSSSIPP